MADDEGFLSRWSRRKAQVRRGEPVPEPVAAAAMPAPPAVVPRAEALAAPATAAPEEPEPAPDLPPPPTLDEALALTPQDDFRRFVAPEVGAEVRNTALKKLWADPHFNVMDGLDIYIDDYGRPDPLPAPMLRRLVQSAALNLFDGEATPAPAPAAEPTIANDEDPALRLQPHDEPGPDRADPGPVPGSGHEH
jgi:hypothetical protein